MAWLLPFEARADLAAQVVDLLRQHNAKLRDQTAQAIVEGGTLHDEPLGRTVHAENHLLMLFLDRHEAHLRAGHRFADSRRIRRRACRSCGTASRTWRAMSLTV